MGCIMAIAGIVIIAYSGGNSFLILVGVVMLIWSFSGGKNKKKTPPVRSGKGHSDGGYDGPVHTGSGTPDYVRTSDGRDIDTHGYGWRESYSGGREGPNGESVEKDVYGNWTYSDSDGDSDSGASFSYDSDD